MSLGGKVLLFFCWWCSVLNYVALLLPHHHCALHMLEITLWSTPLPSMYTGSPQDKGYNCMFACSSSPDIHMLYVMCSPCMSTKSWASLVQQTVIQSQRGETGQTFLHPCSYITGVWDYCRAPVQATLSEVIVIRTCTAWKSQDGYKHFMNIVQCTVCCEFFDLRLEVNYPRPTHQFAAQHFTLMPYAASTILYQQDCDLYQYFVCTYIYKV